MSRMHAIRVTYESVVELFSSADSWIDYAEAKRLAGLLNQASQFRLVDTIILTSKRLEKETGVSRKEFYA